MLTSLVALLANWRLLGVGAVAVALGFGGLQTWRLGHAKHDLAAARAELIDPASKASWRSEEVRDHADDQTCRADLSRLNDALGAQNAAVTALKSESDARLAAATAKMDVAARAVDTANAKAAAVLKATPGADQCASADRLILESVQ